MIKLIALVLNSTGFPEVSKSDIHSVFSYYYKVELKRSNKTDIDKLFVVYLQAPITTSMYHSLYNLQ